MGPYCKVLPIVHLNNLLHSNIETLVYFIFLCIILNKNNSKLYAVIKEKTYLDKSLSDYCENVILLHT